MTTLPVVQKREILPPTTCPLCASRVEFDGTWYFCPNFNCKGKVAGRVFKWVENLKIKYFGEEMVKYLVSSGKIKSVADIYRLTSDDVAQVPRMGHKHFQRMVSHRKLELTWVEILGSLSISNLNMATAEKLLEEHPIESVQDLVKAIEEEKKTKSMGPTKSEMITNGLIQNLNLIEELLTLVKVKQKTKMVQTGVLSGKSVVFTGTLSKPRPVLMALVQSKGGATPSSVSTGTTYLVCEDPASGSSKLKKATQLGVSVISEQEFMNLIQ